MTAPTPAPGSVFLAPRPRAEVDAAIDATVRADTGQVFDIVETLNRGPHFRHGDVTIGLVDITPQIAADWLGRYNTHNRNVVKNAVAGHARDMQAGDWLFIGDTIRFGVDPGGKAYLADGQHRLEGIEKSGVAQTYIVVAGLDYDAQSVMDTQRVRTFANTLSLDEDETGEALWSDVNRLGAIVRRVYLFDELGKLPKGGGARTPTKPELRKFLTMHSARFRAALTVAQAANNVVPRLGKSSTMIAAAYFVLSRKDQEAADLFIREMVIKGFGLADDHPVTHLRRRYGRDGVGVITDDEAFMLTLKAWNHWRKNETLVRALQVPTSGWPQDPREYPIF